MITMMKIMLKIKITKKEIIKKKQNEKPKQKHTKILESI